MLNVIMLSVLFNYCHAECHYAERHYAECQYAGVILLNVLAPLIILLSNKIVGYVS